MDYEKEKKEILKGLSKKEIEYTVFFAKMMDYTLTAALFAASIKILFFI